MAPAKSTMLSTLFDVSEDDMDRSDLQMPTPDSQSENKKPARRGAQVKSKTIAASKVAKSKPTTRRTSATGTAAKTTAKSRKALAERMVVPNDGNDTEEVDDFDEDGENMTTKPVRKAKATKSTSVVAKTAAGVKKTGRAKHVSSDREIPESQPEPMEIEQTEIEDVTIVEAAPLPRQLSSRALPVQLTSRARSTSRQPDLYARHRRAGSASDTERAGEPALRRKLGEMTRKFQSLEMKYRNLKELGSTEAQGNFEKLKRASETRARDQDEIIASLKKELAAQKASSADSRPLRTKNAALESELARLTPENKALASSLSAAQAEIKALQARLAAARSSAQEISKTVPGSAAKARGPRAIESENERLRLLQMKEDLYSDLTGLMIHSIKRLEEEDVYDCIQTGRNGTLHFNLSLSRPSRSATITSTPGNNTTVFEEEEFAYTPLLDEKNDSQLLEILPDYLTEEIVFPRPSASKFYAKVVEFMGRRFE